MSPNEKESNGAHPDHLEIRLGRRKTDVSIIFEWVVKRGLIKCNVAYVTGIFLEEIPTRLLPKTTVRDGNTPPQIVYDKLQMAIVLVKREWGNKMYFMNEREDWEEDDYFEAADLLIQQRKAADERFDEMPDE